MAEPYVLLEVEPMLQCGVAQAFENVCALRAAHLMHGFFPSEEELLKAAFQNFCLPRQFVRNVSVHLDALHAMLLNRFFIP